MAVAGLLTLLEPLMIARARRHRRRHRHRDVHADLRPDQQPDGRVARGHRRLDDRGLTEAATVRARVLWLVAGRLIISTTLLGLGHAAAVHGAGRVPGQPVLLPDRPDLRVERRLPGRRCSYVERHPWLVERPAVDRRRAGVGLHPGDRRHPQRLLVAVPAADHRRDSIIRARQRRRCRWRRSAPAATSPSWPASTSAWSSSRCGWRASPSCRPSVSPSTWLATNVCGFVGGRPAGRARWPSGLRSAGRAAGGCLGGDGGPARSSTRT